ncbi:MAG: hypothetical protein ACYS9Y_04895 [Planctomycetota bacterium]|jgi:hypothetical protein
MWRWQRIVFVEKPAFKLSWHLPLLKLSSLYVDTYEEAGEKGQVLRLGAAGPFWRNRRGRSVSKFGYCCFYIGKSYIGS